MLNLLFSTTAEAQQLGQAEASDWIYSVREGDTLWDLCEKFTIRKTCWLELGDYNGVKFPKSLKPATRIQFPRAWLKSQKQHVRVRYAVGPVMIHESEDAYLASTLDTKANNLLSDNSAIEDGVALSEGSVIETQLGGSAALVLEDGSTVVLDDMTVVMVAQTELLAGDGSYEHSVKLLRGKIKTKIQKRSPRTNFRVKTPSAVAAVRGTEFRFGLGAKPNVGATGAVYTGKISVINTAGNEVLVSKGQGAVVSHSGELTVVQLLPAPTISEIVGAVQLPFTVNWTEVKGAASYQIDVVNAEGGKRIGNHETLEARYELLDLPPDCYQVFARAQDKHGVDGHTAQVSICVEEASVVSEPKAKSDWKEMGAVVALQYLLFLLL